MKTTKKNYLTNAIVVIAMAFGFSACQKNEMQGPGAVTPYHGGIDMQASLLNKTNGGKQAIAKFHSANGSSIMANSGAFTPNANMFGSSYSVWTSKWWQWAMEFPPVANHPFIDDPGFDVTARQSGNVWFLASPFGTVSRACTIPADKAIFLGIINAEASDLEDLGNTYAERLATAIWTADHIVTSSLSCTMDGLPVNLSTYRFVSPEFTFHAPTPWIYGSTGGFGTSVADGYFVMFKPLSAGSHTLHYTGAYHFTLAEDGFDFDASMDITYHITQQ